jgi:hypothetical protein
MGTIKRGIAGLSARRGWGHHPANWQVIPTRRRLFQTRLPATRASTVLLWLFAISIAVGVGMLHRLW